MSNKSAEQTNLAVLSSSNTFCLRQPSDDTISANSTPVTSRCHGRPNVTWSSLTSLAASSRPISGRWTGSRSMKQTLETRPSRSAAIGNMKGAWHDIIKSICCWAWQFISWRSALRQLSTQTTSFNRPIDTRSTWNQSTFRGTDIREVSTSFTWSKQSTSPWRRRWWWWWLLSVRPSQTGSGREFSDRVPPTSPAECCSSVPQSEPWCPWQTLPSVGWSSW